MALQPQPHNLHHRLSDRAFRPPPWQTAGHPSGPTLPLQAVVLLHLVRQLQEHLHLLVRQLQQQQQPALVSVLEALPVQQRVVQARLDLVRRQRHPPAHLVSDRVRERQQHLTPPLTLARRLPPQCPVEHYRSGPLPLQPALDSISEVLPPPRPPPASTSGQRLRPPPLEAVVSHLQQEGLAQRV